MITKVIKAIVKVLMGLFMVFAGFSHLTVAREEFVAQVPVWIQFSPGFTDFVVLASAVNDSAYVALLDKNFHEVARRSFSSPMYAMHMAPWMNDSISISSGICSRISFISRRESSRAETTLFAPCLYQKS